MSGLQRDRKASLAGRMRAQRLGFLSTKERRMKVSDVIEKAISKEIRWLDAARILGVSERQMRRCKLRYEAQDIDGLADARRGKQPRNRVPAAAGGSASRCAGCSYTWTAAN